MPGSLGIFGGTFDPIHHGHLAIAEEVREALGLERVRFIPAGDPPHKPEREVAPAAHRLAMVELAIAPNPGFEVDRSEVDREGPSYSVDTLEAIVAGRAAAGLTEPPWFILSAEALAGLPTWHRPDRVLELARLAVVPREGADVLDAAWLERTFPGRGDRVRFLPGPLLAISGSAVRARAAAGRSLRYLVPEDVAAYVAAHRLYAPDDIATSEDTA